MNDRIISSVIEKKRNPALAFLLSLLSTGCGQMYNGEFARGAMLFLLRCFALLLVPAYLVAKPDAPHLAFIAVMAVIQAVLWTASLIESFLSSLKKQKIRLHNYNSASAYALYCIVTRLVLTACMLTLPAFLGFHNITDDPMGPSFFRGDIVLLNRYQGSVFTAGDVICFRSDGKEGMLRIIARTGDRTAAAGTLFYVNGSLLPVGIFTDAETKKLGLENSEQLFYETAGDKKYPIKARLADVTARLRMAAPAPVPEGMLLAAADDRTAGPVYRFISSKDITGKVEGLVYSSGKMKRLLAQIIH